MKPTTTTESPEKLDPRQCEHCGASLNGKPPNARFCSKEHKLLARYIRRGGVITEKCEYCGGSMSGKQRNARFCSKEHKILARYRRGDNQRARVDPCKQPGCPKKLAVGHTTDYCKEHQRGHRRKPRQICGAAACGKELRLGNATGYCPEHQQLYWENNPEAREQRSQRMSKSLIDSWANDPERRLRTSERTKRFNAERWQPPDWWQKPQIWRVVATELGRQEHISNKDLAQLLDESVKCPYGGKEDRRKGESIAWTKFVATRGGEVFFNRIRNWIKMPPSSRAA